MPRGERHGEGAVPHYCIVAGTRSWWNPWPPSVRSGALSCSTRSGSVRPWGGDTVTYQIDYVTEHPVNTCHAQLTLRWTLPNGWQPGYAQSTCGMHVS